MTDMSPGLVVSPHQSPRFLTHEKCEVVSIRSPRALLEGVYMLHSRTFGTNSIL